MMAYYASKLESSYMIAKDEIARLTAMFKDAFHANYSTNTTHVNTSRFHTNPNIIMDLVIVRKKGLRHVGNRLDNHDVDVPVRRGQRPRQCSICRGVGYDAQNCTDRERI